MQWRRQACTMQQLVIPLRLILLLQPIASWCFQPLTETAHKKPSKPLGPSRTTSDCLYEGHHLTLTKGSICLFGKTGLGADCFTTPRAQSVQHLVLPSQPVCSSLGLSAAFLQRLRAPPNSRWDQTRAKQFLPFPKALFLGTSSVITHGLPRS